MADQQMVGAGEGAISGAAAGAEVGGPWGAVAGGVLGGTLGFLGSNQKGYTLPWDQYNQRLQQINEYSKQLEGATNQYATAIGNMYNTAFSQYVPNAAAALGARGMNIDSGAFGAELGRTAGQLKAQELADVAHQRISNVTAVESQYGNAWGDMFGAANASHRAGFEQGNANIGGLLGIAANIGGQAMRYNAMKRNPWAAYSDNNANIYGGNFGNAPANPFYDMNNATVGSGANDLLG